MRIAVSGTACVGKSTFIQDFLRFWPMYKLADNSYREKLKQDPSFKLNEDGDEGSQSKICDIMIEQANPYTRKDNIIFDRCIVDNLAYSLWLNGKNKVTDNFINNQIPKIKKASKQYDIIFYIPLLKEQPIELVPVEDQTRSLDPVFREEVDNIFRAIYNDYMGKKIRTFFPQEDCPAIIQIFGSREERIAMAKLYVDNNGSCYGEKDSLLKTI